MIFFDHLEGLIANKFEISKKIIRLFKLEATLAGLNILPLIFNCGLLIALILTVWFSAMGILSYLIVMLFHLSVFAALICIFVLNTLFACLILKGIKTNLQRMSFSKTRLVLMHAGGAYGEATHPITADRAS